MAMVALLSLIGIANAKGEIYGCYRHEYDQQTDNYARIGARSLAEAKQEAYKDFQRRQVYDDATDSIECLKNAAPWECYGYISGKKTDLRFYVLAQYSREAERKGRQRIKDVYMNGVELNQVECRCATWLDCLGR